MKTIKCMKCGKEIQVQSNVWRSYCEDCRAETYKYSSSLRASAKYRHSDKGLAAKRRNEKNGNACKKYYLSIYSDANKWNRLKARAARYALDQRRQKYADRYRHQKAVIDTLDLLWDEQGEREKTFFDLTDTYTGQHLRCDVYYPNKKVLVEVNGAQHYVPIRFGNISEEQACQNLLDYQRRDRIKQKFCIKHGIKYVVVPYCVPVDSVKEYVEYQLNHQTLIEITKQFRFAYAHKLESKLLDDQTNRELFGRCNNPNYHGHNAKLQITLKGFVDPLSGMVINFKTLKQIVNKVIDECYDHKNLNNDLMDFEQLPSTCENTLAAMYDRLQKDLILIDHITMYEEDDSYCTYKNEDDWRKEA